MPRGTSGLLSVARALAISLVDEWLLDSGRRRSPDLPKCESGLRFVDREKGFWRRWEVGFCQLRFVWTLLVEGRYIVVRHAKMDHARGLEDFVLKTQKKRQRKKQGEREREKTPTKEWERTNKCAEDTNNLLGKYQEIFSLAEMIPLLLPQVEFFYYCGWATFCSKKLSYIRSSDKEMRKNVQEKKLKNVRFFFNQKLSKNTLKCIFWVQKFKIFPGEGPRTPRSLAGFACFFAGWQKFLRRTLLSLVNTCPLVWFNRIPVFFLSWLQSSIPRLDERIQEE